VLEEGRAEFLAGTIACAEALSRPVFENALALCVDQGVLVEKEKRYELAEAYRDQGRLGSLLTPIDRLLGSQRPRRLRRRRLHARVSARYNQPHPYGPHHPRRRVARPHPGACCARPCRGAGYRVLAASEPGQALEIASSERPDAVLVSVDLPKWEGSTLGKLLRASEGGARLPIIAVDKGHLGKVKGVGAVLEMMVNAYVEDPSRREGAGGQGGPADRRGNPRPPSRPAASRRRSRAPRSPPGP